MLRKTKMARITAMIVAKVQLASQVYQVQRAYQVCVYWFFVCLFFQCVHQFVSFFSILQSIGQLLIALAQGNRSLTNVVLFSKTAQFCTNLSR